MLAWSSQDIHIFIISYTIIKSAYFSRNNGTLFCLQETFQRTQETPVEHRFPTNPPGVIPLPRGSKGPRSLYLKRNGDSFGFTLRHFIVYPPDSIAEQYDGRHAAVGALLAPMDTIFVKQVRERSAARRAGLQQGDRLVAVNGVPVKDKEYSQVVQLVQNSPEYLHLLVVPKEEDVLQRFFAETAYNPVSNQQQQQVDVPYDRQSAQQFLTHHLGRAGGPPGFQVDAISWRSLQQPYHGYPQEFPPLQRVAYDRGQRSADISTRSTQRSTPMSLWAGRSAGPPRRCLCTGRWAVGPAKAAHTTIRPTLLGVQGTDMPSGYPNTAGCRLSLDVGRRESTSSLSSSLADGSKDSLASYDSAATLTGHETDDSAIMTRFRKSVQQKEEFLRTPGVNTVEQALIRKEFYGRPKKLEKQMWPPTESPKASKPTHQNVLRVKGDIESERDLTGMVQKGAASPRERGMKSDLDRVYEAATAPGGYDSLEPFNGSAVEEAYMDDQRQYHSLQLVHRRARDFESGRPPPPDDDPTAAARLTAAGSELSRLGAKRLQPRVTERAMEYDARAATVSPPPQPHVEATGAVPAVRRQPHAATPAARAFPRMARVCCRTPARGFPAMSPLPAEASTCTAHLQMPTEMQHQTPPATMKFGSCECDLARLNHGCRKGVKLLPTMKERHEESHTSKRPKEVGCTSTATSAMEEIPRHKCLEVVVQAAVVYPWTGKRVQTAPFLWKKKNTASLRKEPSTAKFWRSTESELLTDHGSKSMWCSKGPSSSCTEINITK
nr:unnamed protein product [Callosobruchus chinensis]